MIAGYAGATGEQIAATHQRRALIHLCWGAARYLNQFNPQVELVLRADDGNDGGQFNTSASPESEARRWFAIIAQASTQARFAAAVGVNESWSPGNISALRWRIRFETELAKLVRASGLRYYALACPVGNLEYAEIVTLGAEFRALCAEVDAINYHGYLGPRRKSLAEEADDLYLWRPLRTWLPALRAIGAKIPALILGECGTYYPFGSEGLSREQYTRLCIDIDRAYASECARLGVPYLGAAGFGFGTVGTMGHWDQTGTEYIYAQEASWLEFVLGFGEFARVLRDRGIDPGVPTFKEDPCVGTREVVTAQTSTTGEFVWVKGLNDMFWVGKDHRVVAYNGGKLA